MPEDWNVSNMIAFKKNNNQMRCEKLYVDRLISILNNLIETIIKIKIIDTW